MCVCVCVFACMYTCSLFLSFSLSIYLLLRSRLQCHTAVMLSIVASSRQTSEKSCLFVVRTFHLSIFATATLNESWQALYDVRFKFFFKKKLVTKTPFCVCRARVYALCKRAAGERVREKSVLSRKVDRSPRR